VSTKFDSAAGAWKHYFSNSSTSFGDEVGVRLPAWQTAWARWNDTLATPPAGEAAFQYIDRLDKEDGLVSKSEYTTAFDVAATELAIFPFCVSLHDGYWNSSQAWDALGGEDLDQHRWDLVWSDYKPPFNFTKPSAKQSFIFLDSDEDGLVRRSEIDSLFAYCHNTPTTPASAASGTVPQTKTSTITTTSATALLSTTSTQFLTTQPNATIAPTTCCAEVSAQCLSCIAGISVEELCSRNSMSLTPGCQGPAKSTPPQAAPGGPSAFAKRTTTLPPHFQDMTQASAECPYDGVAFTPLLPGQTPSIEDNLATCQARCANTVACGYFTYWRKSRSCQLHPIWATLQMHAEAISGPSVCTARFKARVASVVFARLLKSQLGSLHASLPEVFAEHFGAPLSKVMDVTGARGAVTLLPGSLVMEGKVLLPAGMAMDRVKDRPLADLKRNVAHALLAANVPYLAPGIPAVQAEDAVPFSMEVSADATCFLDGSAFISNEQEDVSADSPADCQARCQSAGNCTAFSYNAGAARCSLIGGNSTAAPSKVTISGPSRCANVPAVASRDVSPAGASLVALVDKSPWYTAMAIVALVCTLALMYLACWYGNKKKRKGQRKTGKWHDKALYLPVASEDGAQAPQGRVREVSRDRPDKPQAAQNQAGTLPANAHFPAPAISFHGPDVLSWRQPGPAA